MDNVVNKQDLIDLISEKSGFSKKDATAFLNSYLSVVSDSLAQGKEVKIVGFGTFKVKERAARQGRNPRNPEEIIDIPACKSPVFKAGTELKKSVQQD